MAVTAPEGPERNEEPDKAGPHPGPIEQMLSALGLGRRPKPEAGAAEDRAGHALVDQAEAFQTVTVADVMIPRADIVALDVVTPLSDVVAEFVDSEHSRLPIYRDTLDDPIGFVHIKDVFRLIAGKMPPPDAGEAVLGRLRRETLYVPASMRAADLLVRMQARHIHLAMVIDEFGGVDGLVSMEDVIEAVVGEIDDEHDVAEKAQIVARPDGAFEVAGRTELANIEAALARKLTMPEIEDEIDTIAGLVAAVAGRVPQRGEIIALSPDLEAEVTDADPRRIKRLRLRSVTPPPPPAPEEA
jgi:CBS domain containing-hemolysin-like protein